MALSAVKDEMHDVPGVFQNNLTALVWGHNNATGTKVVTEEECGEITSKTSRVWLVQNTGESKTVQIGAYADSDDFASFPYNSAYDVYLLVSSDPTMNTYDQLIKGEWVDGKLLVNYTFPENSIKYISFSGIYVGASCETCEFTGTKKLEFTNSNWDRGDVTNTYNLGDGFTAQVNVSLQSPSVWANGRYPRASSRKSLKEYRKRGNGDNLMQTEVILSKAAAVTFEIFEIDRRYVRYDDVEVYGLCGGAIVMPKLSYSTSANRSSYVISGNKANANNRTSSYTNARGRMYVEFEHSVERIIIKHKYNGGPVTGRKRLGIGPMEFVCPAPLPAPTEDGLIFTKQGSTDVLLCEEVDYTFRIVNTNCDPYPVNFSDVLPAGMTWVSGSLSIDDNAIVNATINDYEGTNSLTIDGLEIPGGGSTFTFRAKAIFTDTAVAGNYANRANIAYQSNVNPGIQVNLQSCDRLTAGCEPTMTNAIASDRPKPLLTSIKTNKSCYAPEGELIVTLSVNNQNPQTITDAILDLGFDDNFTYVSGSLYSSTLSLTGSSVITEIEDGSISLEGFNIPSGLHEISFKLKSPTQANMYYINPTDLLPVPLTIDYAFESDSDDICLGASTANANGELELPYCTYCTQEPSSGNAKSSDVGISTFKNQIANWPENVANGYLVLESYKKGMVLSRQKASDIPTNKLVEGMIIYDTEDRCIKIYNGIIWNCIERKCNNQD